MIGSQPIDSSSWTEWDTAQPSPHSLFAFALQQEVAAEAGLTFVPHTVVLAVDAHGTDLRGALHHPLCDLQGNSGQG